MIRRLGKESTLYAIGTFFQRIAALLLVPLYTSALSISEYGALETLTVIVQMLIILLNFGLNGAVIRYYVECTDNKEVAVMLRTSSVLVIGFSVGLFILFQPLFGPIGAIFFGDAAYSWFIMLAFGWAIGGAFNRQLFAYYRARQDARTYVILSLSFFFFLIVINVYLVRFLNLKLTGILFGNLIVMWGTDLWMASRFWRQGWSISWHWASKLLKFGFPLIFSMFGWLILNSADRYFLAYYRDLSEVGIYSLGYKVGLMVQIAVVTPFQLAWGPFVFNQSAANKEHITQGFSRAFTYLLLAFSIVGLGLFLFAAEIVQILGTGSFSEATAVVPYVLIAYLFSGIYFWAASFFHLTKKVVLLSAIVFAMAGLNLLLNWIWVPQWGWLGAAYTTVVTIGGTGLLMLLVGQFLYPVPLQVMRLIKIALGVAIVIIVYNLTSIPAGIMGWGLRLGMLLLLPVWLIITNFFDRTEIKMVAPLPRLLLHKFHFRS